MIRRLPVFIASVILIVAVAACSISYRFNGASIDYTKTKTISIADFPIRATLVYPPLAAAFNEAMKDQYTRQTKLQFVNQNADIQIEGEITGYALSPQAVKEDAFASLTRLTVTIRVKYSNNANEKANFDRSFSAYRDFSSTLMLDNVQDALIKEIVTELVDVIFNATLGDW
ncbi:LptE family protein [Porphyromonadaceae bacterium]